MNDEQIVVWIENNGVSALASLISRVNTYLALADYKQPLTLRAKMEMAHSLGWI